MNNNMFGDSLENVLEKYGRDIVAAAKDGKIDPVIGRDEEIRNITRILSRKTKNNPVLIGEPGVGKTAIAEGLAWRIYKQDVPFSLKDKKVYSLGFEKDWCDALKIDVFEFLGFHFLNHLLPYRGTQLF